MRRRGRAGGVRAQHLSTGAVRAVVRFVAAVLFVAVGAPPFWVRFVAWEGGAMGFMGTQRDGTFFGAPDWCVLHSRVRLCPGVWVEEGGPQLTVCAWLCARVDLKKKPGYTNISAVYPDMSFGWLMGWCVSRGPV